MKRQIYTIITLFILLLSLDTQKSYALEYISFYLGGKIGYNHTLTGSGHIISSTGISRSSIESSTASGAPFILAAGLELPVLKNRLAFRTELELGIIVPSNSNAPISSSSFSANSITTEIGIQTLFTNAFLDIYLSEIFYIYVSTGVGVAIIDRKLLSPVKQKLNQDITFAWNAGFGIGHYITKNTFFDIGVRYTDFASGSSANIRAITSQFSSLKYSAIQLLFTVAYKF